MNSMEGYQTYKEKEIDFLEIYPSIFRFLLFLFGFIDLVFGSIFLLVMLVKGIFDLNYLIVLFLSWFGGINCLKVARRSSLKKLSNIMLFGLILGFVFGAFYIYAIILSFSRL